MISHASRIVRALDSELVRWAASPVRHAGDVARELTELVNSDAAWLYLQQLAGLDSLPSPDTRRLVIEHYSIKGTRKQ